MHAELLKSVNKVRWIHGGIRDGWMGKCMIKQA